MNGKGKVAKTGVTQTLFILNGVPYSTERAYNALRMAGREDQRVRGLFIGRRGEPRQGRAEGVRGVLQRPAHARQGAGQGGPSLCGTCMDVRGLLDAQLIEGARRSTLAELAQWTATADKVLVF